MNLFSRTAMLFGCGAVALALVFGSLGMWQLERARWKTQRLELQRLRIQQAPVTIGAAMLDGNQLQFAPVTMEGVFEPRLQVLIDNVTHKGVAGYEVITPFRPRRSDTRVWVNRGWLPWGGDRSRLPPTPAPTGNWRLSGHARQATGGRLRLGGGGCCETTPPGPWLDLDMESLRAIAPWPMQPFVVRLDPGPPQDGLMREREPHRDGWIQRHQAYALQWFALAAMAPLFWVTLMLRRRKARHL